MSLINDALKRAEADQQQTAADPAANPATDPGTGFTLEPAQLPPSAPGASDEYMPVVPARKSHVPFALVALLVLAGGGFAAWKVYGHRIGAMLPQNASATAVVAAVKPAVTQAVQNAAAAKLADAAKSPNASPIFKALAPQAGKGPPTPQSIALSPGGQSADQMADTIKSLLSMPSMPASTPSTSSGQASSGQTAPPQAVAATPPPAARPAPAFHPADVKISPENYHLSGLLLGPDGGQAIINGRVMKVGQTIEGARLIRILSHSVEMEMGGKKFTVGM